MKVLVVSHSAVVTEYRDKFHHLARSGVEIHLALPQWWPEGGRRVEAPDSGEEQGLTLHILPVVFAGHVARFLLPTLGEVVRRVEPDLVHVEEEPYAIACWQALRQACQGRRPGIFFTWENILRTYRTPLNWIDQYSRTHAAAAVAGNREAEAVLRSRGFEAPVAVIPQYGVDPERFRAMPEVREHKPRDQFVIGYVGRLLEAKGVQTLLQACARLGGRSQVVITGSGPYGEDLAVLAAELGISPSVSFVPSRPHDQMPEVYNSLDVLVLPSLTTAAWKEQFGRVLIEAMACEVPVVGSDSGEIPEVIGNAGLVFPEGREEQLTRALASLRDNPLVAADLVRLGRERVQKLFTNERIAQRTLAVYQEASGAAPCASS